ncbi:hypothetical protein PTKIN_Ptkin16aG0494200 [Pterospermum kingtungense]
MSPCGDSEGNLSGFSISDEKIEIRNSILRREANRSVMMCDGLGLMLTVMVWVKRLLTLRWKGVEFSFLRPLDFKCGIGNIYAPNDDVERSQFWDELYMKLWRHGKSNGAELVDLPLVGGQFTWCNNWEKPSYSRLDRFLLSSGFLEKFPNLCQRLWPRSVLGHFSVKVKEEWDLIKKDPTMKDKLWEQLKRLKVVYKERARKKRYEVANSAVLEKEIHLLENEVNAIPLRNFDCVFRKLSDSNVVELESRLKVNMVRSKIFGIGVGNQELASWAMDIGCVVESLPTTYLGLPLGAHAYVVSVWDPIDDKFQRRLAVWKAGPLSLEGRALLVRSVLSSLPVFYINCKKFSILWKNITKSLFNDGVFGDIIKSNTGFSVGNGERIDFWECEWISGVVIKDVFPRVYALAIKKSGKISEFGYFLNEGWVWKIPLRRRPFGWEMQQWNNFYSLISGQKLCRLMVDKVIWKRCASGNFSVKSFCVAACIEGNDHIETWKLWAGLAPPKVETFCWQVIIKRVAVKEELVKRNLIHYDVPLCAFCKEEMETVDHLFCHCQFTWSMWSHWMKVWGVLWCCPKDVGALLSTQQGLLPMGMCVKVWMMCFFAGVWSIWLFKNEVVFNNSNVDLNVLIDHVGLRLASLSKAKWPEILGVMDFARNPSLNRKCDQGSGVRAGVVWCPPVVGKLKFNVDCSALGQPGPAGIRGILCDCNAKVKVVFSKAMGISDSNFAELMVASEAFNIFLHFEWVSCYSLIIESDSLNVVKWVKDPNSILGDSRI